MAATVASSALLLGTARPAAANPLLQFGWRFCGKCYGLFYGGFGTFGRCPAGGQHTGSPSNGTSHDYYVTSDYGSGQYRQAGWAYCPRCESMTWAPGNGWCPGGVHHVLQGNSLPYELNFGYLEDIGYQANWKFCQKCMNVAYGGGAPGVCAAGGRHDHSSTLDYGMWWWTG